jgi:hypothetical protein
LIGRTITGATVRSLNLNASGKLGVLSSVHLLGFSHCLKLLGIFGLTNGTT